MNLSNKPLYWHLWHTHACCKELTDCSSCDHLGKTTGPFVTQSSITANGAISSSFRDWQETPTIFLDLSLLKGNGITFSSQKSKCKSREFSGVFRLLGVRVEIHISIPIQDNFLLISPFLLWYCFIRKHNCSQSFQTLQAGETLSVNQTLIF